MYIFQMIDGFSVDGAQQLQIVFAKEAKRHGCKVVVIRWSNDEGSPFAAQLKALGAEIYFSCKDHILVGRLVGLKSFEDLFNAFLEVLMNNPDLLLAIVGEGEMRDVLERKIKGFGLNEYVRLFGARTDELRLLSVSDVFALASNREGFSIIFWEAMVAGLLVISTDVGGNSWALDTAGSGVLPQNPHTFAGTVKYLLNNPDRRGLLEQNTKTTITEYFCSATWFDSFHSVYIDFLQ